MIANHLSLVKDAARNSLSALHADERGQGMTEYVILLVGIAVVCIAISVQFGGKLKALIETADAELDTVDSNI
jgi:Flp pilus assembly pilin Flp